MLMSVNDRMQYAQMLSYSPTAWDAVGLSHTTLRTEDAALTSITYNRLLTRWNQPGAQGNLYALSSAGLSDHAGSLAPAATLGLEADWESRRYYVAYENSVIFAADIRQTFNQKMRVGIAPYLAEYDGLHGWLMLQIDHNPSERHPVILTPMLRLFTTQFLAEAGISNRGDLMLNATYPF